MWSTTYSDLVNGFICLSGLWASNNYKLELKGIYLVMKNKADLYKQSKPHNVQTAFDNKVTFKVIIGTWMKNRAIIIEAYGLNIAIADATNLCRKDEKVLEITKDGQLLWKHSND